MGEEDERINIRLFGGHYWSEVCKKIRKARVFMDAEINEVLHFNGGLKRTHNICSAISEFSSFVHGTQDDKKAVFILSKPVQGLTLDILGNIFKAYCFY